MMNDELVTIAQKGYVSVTISHVDARPSTASANAIGGEWWVARVIVDDKCRGQGVGKRLVAKMLQLCEVQGAKQVKVCPGGYDNNVERQRGFYEACGFVPQPGEEHIMIWEAK